MDTTTHFKIKSLSPLLLVGDLEHSLQFYNSMEFETAFIYDGFYAGIAKDGYTIHLKLCEPDTAEREGRRKNEHLDIVFSVEKIEQLYETMKNRPVDIIQPLRQMPYGREFYISDPDCYILGFVNEN